MPSLFFTLAHPLPPDLAPDRVVRHLHRYEPLITPNPFVVSFRRRPVDLDEILDDPFFRDDGHALAAFEVVDRVVLVPGLPALSKQIVIPCVMQRFAGGLRCRSFAAGGVRVWSTWRVLPAAHQTARAATTSGKQQRRTRKTTQTFTPPDTPPATPPKDDDATAGPAPPPLPFMLVEEAHVECGAMVKPFVGRSFQSAHLAILRKIIGAIPLEELEEA